MQVEKDKYKSHYIVVLFIRQKVVSHIQCCLSLKKMLCDVRELERDLGDKIEITESGLQQKV